MPFDFLNYLNIHYIGQPTPSDLRVSWQTSSESHTVIAAQTHFKQQPYTRARQCL